MKSLYQDILTSMKNGEKLLAILIDPDKMQLEKVSRLIKTVNESKVSHIFVGGSLVEATHTDPLILEIKKYTTLPVILFPGDVSQVTDSADGLLFLSLISGRNPDYLIGKQVEAVSKLRTSNLEIIPTAYVLIENGKETSVQRVTGTNPIKRNKIQLILDTAKAGELLGMKLIYLEAGSGALHPIPSNLISRVKKEVSIPLIVGGGIKTINQLATAYNSGADMVVIGTAFEENENFFDLLNLKEVSHGSDN